jgi:hypothetical protein
MLGAAPLLPLASNAADFDGSKNLLCTTIDAAECLIGPSCASVTPEELNLPQFIFVDFKGRKLSGRTPGGSQETTAIQNIQKVEGRTILQGAERGRGWSIVIHQDSGKMAGSVAALSEDDVRLGVVLLGSCTPDL